MGQFGFFFWPVPQYHIVFSLVKAYQFNKVMGQLERVPFLTCPNDAATYVKVMLICPELMCWKDLTFDLIL